jgi:hypothetical protein
MESAVRWLVCRGRDSYLLSQPRAGVVLLYRSKYCPLHEAVQLTAARLAAADPKKYANDGAAIEDARQELLNALFEGAVRAEGVRVYPAEEPPDEPPSVDYPDWRAIDRGVWIHETCEVEKRTYRLDTIFVLWAEDAIDYHIRGEWAEYMDIKIRLLYDDIDREFPAVDALSASDAPSATSVKQDYRTGLPGRPSSKYLASQEMRRRAEVGTLSLVLAEEMRELCRWLEREHPDKPRAKPKALGAALRHEYWSLKRGMDLSR